MFQFAKIFLLCLVATKVSALTGGSATTRGQFPAFVGVILPFNQQVCGATVFNVNHVLTVANCVLSSNHLLLAPEQLSIIFGTNTIDYTLPRVSVQAVYVHPHYNPFTFENDIAVVRTRSNFNFPQVPVPLLAPAPISTRIAYDTQNCRIVAWNTGNNVQQTLNVPILNRDSCNSLPLNFGRITETMICAGSLSTGTGACVMNKGAGLYCNDRLEGVLSSGFSCGTIANNPGVYTQVRFFIPWIEEQVRRQDIPPANVSPIERMP